MQFSKINNIIGWLIFLIAATTYTLTIEPTGSFWDCGEFVSAAYKLQVVHPPGAPMFLIIVRLFTLLAGGNTENVAYWANFSSGMCSAFTILFLFWTISHLAKKMLQDKEGNLTSANLIATMGAAAVGALAYTFSDTFWFSAVEGEVYAMSSMFTALVFWAILKWENVADEPKSDRWLVFIALLLGASIGVHLLNLLTIPCMAFVYYFKKTKAVSTKGIAITAVIGMLILGVIQGLIIPGVISVAGAFDLMFVNSFHLPFYSGMIFWALTIVAGLTFGIRYTIQKGKVIANTALLCLAALLIGYGSYIAIIIRAKASPNINMYQTDQVFNLLSYLNREQYGDSYLLNGPTYNSKPTGQKEKGTEYRQTADEYIEVGKKTSYTFDKEVFFPRMSDFQTPSRVQFYKDWCKIKGNKNPTFGDHLYFFFTYQVGHMYFRYFMWNFAGRQNDIQGQGNIADGNWISGIKPLDAIRLGPQDNLPATTTENKAHNTLFFLPFALGILGLYFHFQKNKYDASIVAMLFVFTGLAITVYLNPPPLQPRERDYAFVGSFYAYAIWIGLGVLYIFDFLQKKLNPKNGAIIATAICLLTVPALMASQEWDDHDRSKKYTARDFAYNYLNSCAPNAILFTYGDNDTYPLWYAQEVEGIRTDVRVINLSLLGMDWFINQMKKPNTAGVSVPFTLSSDKYLADKRNYIQFYDENLPGPQEAKDVLAFITSDDERALKQMQSGEFMNTIPTKNLKFTVNKADVLANKVVGAQFDSLIVDKMEWTLNKNNLVKNDLMVFDLIANNNWKRPIYFTITMGNENFLGLEKYFQLDGLCYRLTPVLSDRNSPGQLGRINSDLLYDNLVNKFKWGNMNQNIYIDPESSRMCLTIRNLFFQLAEQLIAEGKKDKALTAIDKCESVLPQQKLPTQYEVMKFRIGQIYAQLDKKDKANKIFDDVMGRISQDMDYYSDLQGKRAVQFSDDIRQNVAVTQEIARTYGLTGQADRAKKLNDQAAGYINKFGPMLQ